MPVVVCTLYILHLPAASGRYLSFIETRERDGARLKRTERYQNYEIENKPQQNAVRMLLCYSWNAKLVRFRYVFVLQSDHESRSSCYSYTYRFPIYIYIFIHAQLNIN